MGAALLFGAGIWNILGAEKAQEFFAGYLLEQSLSVDNLFVFILVFRYFRAPKADQDKVCACMLTVERSGHDVLGAQFLTCSCTMLTIAPSVMCCSMKSANAAVSLVQAVPFEQCFCIQTMMQQCQMSQGSYCQYVLCLSPTGTNHHVWHV